MHLLAGPGPETPLQPGMVHPDQARQIIFDAVSTLGAEPVALADASGRILAEDLIADREFPDFAAATMDGFAVVAEDHSPWREIIGEQTAGAPLNLTVSEGYAVRITTGAPAPSGANAVVPVEETTETENHVVIERAETRPGENLRRIGADMRRGDIVVPAGVLIGAPELGLIASLGPAEITVRTRPRVSILSTGDELLEPGDPPAPGRIFDANRFSLLASMRESGAEIVWTGKAPDTMDELRSLLVERMANSDIVITSGGVSMGGLDLIKPLLTELTEVHFRRIFLKPGKPFNFATKANTLVFGLPGNPVSALAITELFVLPAIRKMQGQSRVDRPFVTVTLREPVDPSDRIELQRGVVMVDPDGRLVAVANGSQGSSRLGSFQGANALLVIHPREGAYETGERVTAMLLAAPFAAGA